VCIFRAVGCAMHECSKAPGSDQLCLRALSVVPDRCCADQTQYVCMYIWCVHPSALSTTDRHRTIMFHAAGWQQAVTLLSYRPLAPEPCWLGRAKVVAFCKATLCWQHFSSMAPLVAVMASPVTVLHCGVTSLHAAMVLPVLAVAVLVGGARAYRLVGCVLYL
jgi:hypothetical protein